VVTINSEARKEEKMIKKAQTEMVGRLTMICYAMKANDR
jgi:hypothetical protein